jgi:hypothetical protein
MAWEAVYGTVEKSVNQQPFVIGNVVFDEHCSG